MLQKQVSICLNAPLSLLFVFLSINWSYFGEDQLKGVYTKMSATVGNTTSYANHSEDDLSSETLTLQDLNDEEVRRRLAPMIYLGILILIGLPGNITVLVVYATKFKQSTHRTFILALAAIDTVACAVCMPFEIIEMNFQYTFYVEGACKFFRFNNTFIAISSIFVLLFLSSDRYRRVYHPFKEQITVKTSVIFCTVAVLLAALFSWPIFFLLGTRHVELRGNITGYDCSTSDTFRKTKFPFIHNAILLLLFVLVIVTLVVLYVLIGKQVIKHAAFRQKFSVVKSSSLSSSRTKSTSVSGKSEIHSLKKVGQNKENVTSKDNTNGSKTSTIHAASSKIKNENKESKSEVSQSSMKITKIAFMISLTFILSYLPHLILTIMTAVKGGFVAKPGPVVSAVLPIVTRSIFINNVANAFIYGFYDSKFRRSIKNGIKGLFKFK